MDYDTQLINLALDAGEIMLASGAETFRVQDTMQRILSVSGKEKIEALAMCTLLMVTLPREEKGPLSMARAIERGPFSSRGKVTIRRVHIARASIFSLPETERIRCMVSCTRKVSAPEASMISPASRARLISWVS